MRLRSPYDREIVRLGAPALGALAAEPLYLLVDTAIVGHLGRPQLAALGIAATVLSGLFALFNFLTYSTTAQVARASGAGEDEAARHLGAQALWLSLAAGCLLAAVTASLAGPIVEAVGADGEVADLGATYLRIASAGLPFGFIALGGQGYLRGIADLRFPFLLLVAGNLVNAVLEAVFVYGLDWGISGSAWGTVIAQAGMGAAFVLRVTATTRGALQPSLRAMRRLLAIGRHIFVRTAALYGTFLLAGAAAARFGASSIAAHQIVMSLWVFLALVLDAVAIAGQVIVGRSLGAGDVEGAYAAAARMILLSLAAGAAIAAVMLALRGPLPHAFTSDAAVLERADAVWLVFALMQVLGGAAFALDGILIGAGDGPFLMWSMLAAFACAAAVAAASLVADWGLVGVWFSILALLAARVVMLGMRFRRRRWLVTGWA